MCGATTGEVPDWRALERDLAAANGRLNEERGDHMETVAELAAATRRAEEAERERARLAQYVEAERYGASLPPSPVDAVIAICDGRAEQTRAAEAGDEATAAKLAALLAGGHGTCACSIDRAEDMCSHHSPRLVAAEARERRLKEALERVGAAMARERDCLDQIWAAIGDRLLAKGPLSREYAGAVTGEVNAAKLALDGALMDIRVALAGDEAPAAPREG